MHTANIEVLKNAVKVGLAKPHDCFSLHYQENMVMLFWKHKIKERLLFSLNQDKIPTQGSAKP